MFAECRMGVVYKVTFSISRFYVGQTWRCVNWTLFEHKRFMAGETLSNLSLLCRHC